jgi:hypothetical protein
MSRVALVAIRAIARTVTMSIIRDRHDELLLQFQRVFQRTKLDVWRIIASALSVIASAAERVIIAAALHVRSADDTKRAMGTHRWSDPLGDQCNDYSLRD